MEQEDMMFVFLSCQLDDIIKEVKEMKSLLDYYARLQAKKEGHVN